MERKIRILIADNSSAFSIECQKELGLQGFDVVAIDKDGKKVIDILDKQNFDVIMIDTFMPNADAVEVIEHLAASPKIRPIVTVFCSVNSPQLEMQIMEAGADYYFIKPVSAGSVAKRITSLAQWKSKSLSTPAKAKFGENEMDIIISDIMRQIGVPAHIKGYHYLRTAIKLCIEDNEMLSSVTKILCIPPLQKLTAQLRHELKGQFATPSKLLGTGEMLMSFQATSDTQFSAKEVSRQTLNLLQ